MVALNGIQRSSLAILVGAEEELKTLKIFNYADEELFENERYTTTVELTAHTLIAVPESIGGVLILGEYIISYLDPSAVYKEISMEPVMVTAHAFLKNNEKACVLADNYGDLHLLTFRVSSTKVNGLSLTTIGQVKYINT